MAHKKRREEIEIDEDMEFERRSWRWQRVGWGVILLILLAALLGLFGTGWLDRAVAGQPGSQLWLEYNRFGRLQAETSRLEVHLGPGTGANGKVRIWLNHEYMQGVRVTSVTPEPESVEAGPERFTYVFNVPDSSQQTLIIFRLEPDKMGRLKGEVGLEGGASLGFKQFIYP
ncbi:MAG TPA: hypothetical protein VGO91_11390 [Pyrinomonadaceae bacterium]|jgi:hypothetical protein|nr:hypothetical protein [Pyrinomonadaceae bacterium]